MSGLSVTLFDYGVGNLHSIQKALARGGARVTVTRDGRDLLDAQAIVLPGVGAFGACMEPLEDVRADLRDRLLSGVPCLAVCIGMQLLFEGSEESRGVPGIGVFRGDIKRLQGAVKVPHMGWNALHGPTMLPRWDARSGVGLRWEEMLPGAGAHVYYVHSYYAAPTEPVTLRATTYGDTEYAAVVARGNTIATQFHPEKSSGIGLEIVSRWVQAASRHMDQPEAQP